MQHVELVVRHEADDDLEVRARARSAAPRRATGRATRTAARPRSRTAGDAAHAAGGRSRAAGAASRPRGRGRRASAPRGRRDRRATTTPVGLVAGRQRPSTSRSRTTSVRAGLGVADLHGAARRPGPSRSAASTAMPMRSGRPSTTTVVASASTKGASAVRSSTAGCGMTAITSGTVLLADMAADGRGRRSDTPVESIRVRRYSTRAASRRASTAHVASWSWWNTITGSATLAASGRCEQHRGHRQAGGQALLRPAHQQRDPVAAGQAEPPAAGPGEREHGRRASPRTPRAAPRSAPTRSRATTRRRLSPRSPRCRPRAAIAAPVRHPGEPRVRRAPRGRSTRCAT